MRADALGFFWEDTPVQKIKKTAEKREPPEPVWLADSYLPGLEEAAAFNVEIMTPQQAAEEAQAGHTLVYDVESFWNYFVVGFKSVETGRVIFVEAIGKTLAVETAKLEWLMSNFRIVGFNSISYDLPIVSLAVAGLSVEQLKEASDMIITSDFSTWQILSKYKVKELSVNHIDLIDVAPLSASLKTYGARLHSKKLQDLPFPPQRVLSLLQMECVRWYNINDLDVTIQLFQALSEQIHLRESMTHETDLRSKSDAQIAEAVITDELQKLSRKRPKRVFIEPGTAYRYQVPIWMRFQTPLMQSVLARVRDAEFVVGEHGSILTPAHLKKFSVTLGSNEYRMGIGGLHSSEQRQALVADEEYMLVDKDVTSYYPSIILNLSLFPKHLGPNFLRVYREIVQRRVRAKHSGDKVTADTLKITVNGSFGKFGSKYSLLYSPDLLFQVTVTGQLALLMLIESIELAGIQVASANTDGLVIRCKRDRKQELDAIVAQWEQITKFATEESEYQAVYSKDVNNYIALKLDGTFKRKGAYVNPKDAYSALWKNPVCALCLDAVEAYLSHATPVLTTVKGCKDVTKILSVRTVKGGAVKLWQDGRIEYLGKSIRWYYALDEKGEIVYAKSGNKVPRTDGAKPLMQLPEEMPLDVDWQWYVDESYKILKEIGAND